MIAVAQSYRNGPGQERVLWVELGTFDTASGKDRCLRIPVVHCVPRHCVFARLRSEPGARGKVEMLRVLLNAWVTKTTAAEILARPEGVKSR